MESRRAIMTRINTFMEWIAKAEPGPGNHKHAGADYPHPVGRLHRGGEAEGNAAQQQDRVGEYVQSTQKVEDAYNDMRTARAAFWERSKAEDYAGKKTAFASPEIASLSSKLVRAEDKWHKLRRQWERDNNKAFPYSLMPGAVDPATGKLTPERKMLQKAGDKRPVQGDSKNGYVGNIDYDKENFNWIKRKREGKKSRRDA